MLSLRRILISDLVTNLFMHSLPGMILLLLGCTFFTPKVFLHKIIINKLEDNDYKVILIEKI